MNKVKKIIGVVLVILGIAVIAVGVYFLVLAPKKDEPYERHEKIKRFEEVSELPKVESINNVEVNSGNDIVASSFYDGYYISISDVDDSIIYYLKRNTKVVAELKSSDEIKMYKDSSDPDSRYIAVKFFENSFSVGQFVDEDYALINDEDKNTSVIYNIKTGEKKEFTGQLNLVTGNAKSHITLYNDGKINIVDKTTLTPLTLDSNWHIVGNNAPNDESGSVFSFSSDYIVVKNDQNKKYGLMSYDGKLKIDFKYDDLVTVTDSILYAKKDNKYGVIDASGKEIVPFKYDGIIKVGDNYVVLKDKKLALLDKNQKEIIAYKYKTDGNYNLRDATDNSFGGGYDIHNDQNYFYYINDNVKRLVVIDSDNSYHETAYYFLTRYYNFSKGEYYYADTTSDDSVTLLDSKGKEVTKLSCSDDPITFNGFSDHDIVNYYCGDNDVKYYDLKKKKEIKSEDLSGEYRDAPRVISTVNSVSGIYIFDHNYHIINESGELLEELNNVSKMEYLFKTKDNFEYYKTTFTDGTVKYYRINFFI